MSSEEEDQETGGFFGQEESEMEPAQSADPENDFDLEHEKQQLDLEHEKQQLEIMPMPSIVTMSDIILRAMDDRKMTAPEFCTLFLQGDAGEPTEKPHRQGKLLLQDGYILVVEGHPKFADIIYTAMEKVVDRKLLGVVSSVRQVGTAFEVELEKSKIGQSIFDGTSRKEIPIYLEDFHLGVASRCEKEETCANVVATFVGLADAEKIFRSWIINTTLLYFDEVTSSQLEASRTKDDYASWVMVVAAAFHNRLQREIGEGKMFTCDFQGKGELVDGKCEEIFENAVLSVGEMSAFSVYSKNTQSFMLDFQSIINNETPAEWVDEFCAFFIIDEPSYNALKAQEKDVRLQLVHNKDQCTGQFLLRIHRNMFECYLMQLNNLWQQTDATMLKIAAVMWLLFYTQLPVFVFQLLKRMAPSKPMMRENVRKMVNETVTYFHQQLTEHLSGFLPILDDTNAEQKDLIAEIYLCLKNIEPAVVEQMLDNVEQQIPECL